MTNRFLLNISLVSYQSPSSVYRNLMMFMDAMSCTTLFWWLADAISETHSPRPKPQLWSDLTELELGKDIICLLSAHMKVTKIGSIKSSQFKLQGPEFHMK